MHLSFFDIEVRLLNSQFSFFYVKRIQIVRGQNQNDGFRSQYGYLPWEAPKWSTPFRINSICKLYKSPASRIPRTFSFVNSFGVFSWIWLTYYFFFNYHSWSWASKCHITWLIFETSGIQIRFLEAYSNFFKILIFYFTRYRSLFPRWCVWPLWASGTEDTKLFQRVEVLYSWVGEAC